MASSLSQGPACEESLLGSCRSSSNATRPFISWVLPKSCACLRQMRALVPPGVFQYSWREVKSCYERLGGLSDDLQFSDPPTPGAKDVRWRMWKRSVPEV